MPDPTPTQPNTTAQATPDPQAVPAVSQRATIPEEAIEAGCVAMFGAGSKPDHGWPDYVKASVADIYTAMSATQSTPTVVPDRDAVDPELLERLQYALDAPTGKEFVLRKAFLTRHDVRRILALVRCQGERETAVPDRRGLGCPKCGANVARESWTGHWICQREGCTFESEWPHKDPVRRSARATIRERLQAAWDSFPGPATLPPIEFTDEESAHLASALLSSQEPQP